MTRSAIALMVALVSGCVIFQRPLEVPEGNDAAIIMASTAMPEPIENIARHAWFAVREKGSEKWRRIEVGGFGRHPLAGISDVRVHGVWRGKKAEKAIKCLRKHAAKARPGSRYLPWPGPNSNTFVDVLARKCKLRADLPATAIGKDYRGLFGASWTAGGTGFQVETPIVGFKIGLTEGIELHIFGLVIGIDLWPPAIIVPVGSGRIGFDDR